MLRERAGDPGIAASDLVDSIVAGRGLSRYDIRDDRGKALTAEQKDRLCREVLHPVLQGYTVKSRQIIKYQAGYGEVKAVLVDSKGQESKLMFSTTKGPNGILLRVSTFLRPIWDFQSNPSAAVNLSWAEKTKLRAPYVREMAPKLEAIGITEVEAEDGEFHPISELANVYESWE